jgi:hypothetical protein
MWAILIERFFLGEGPGTAPINEGTTVVNAPVSVALRKKSLRFVIAFYIKKAPGQTRVPAYY